MRVDIALRIALDVAVRVAVISMSKLGRSAWLETYVGSAIGRKWPLRLSRPRAEPQTFADGDPYGRGREGWKPTVFCHFLRGETTLVYSAGVLTIVSTLAQ
ncbi:MAG: hypothetical protein C0429_11405 [Sphingopyxis sp.]|nr:hypothetical protein [Sphingopyxis sp.]